MNRCYYEISNLQESDLVAWLQKATAMLRSSSLVGSMMETLADAGY